MKVALIFGSNSELVKSKLEGVLDSFEFSAYPSIREFTRQAELTNKYFERIVLGATGALGNDEDTARGNIELLKNYLLVNNTEAKVVLIEVKNKMTGYDKIFMDALGSPIRTAVILESSSIRTMTECCKSSIEELQAKYYILEKEKPRSINALIGGIMGSSNPFATPQAEPEDIAENEPEQSKNVPVEVVDGSIPETPQTGGTVDMGYDGDDLPEEQPGLDSLSLGAMAGTGVETGFLNEDDWDDDNQNGVYTEEGSGAWGNDGADYSQEDEQDDLWSGVQEEQVGGWGDEDITQDSYQGILNGVNTVQGHQPLQGGYTGGQGALPTPQPTHNITPNTQGSIVVVVGCENAETTDKVLDILEASTSHNKRWVDCTGEGAVLASINANAYHATTANGGIYSEDGIDIYIGGVQNNINPHGITLIQTTPNNLQWVVGGLKDIKVKYTLNWVITGTYAGLHAYLNAVSNHNIIPNNYVGVVHGCEKLIVGVVDGFYDEVQNIRSTAIWDRVDWLDWA